MLIPFGVFSAGVSSGNGGAGSFDLISTTVLGSSAASVTFDVTGLGSTYKHLQVRMLASNSGSGVMNTRMRFNGDTGSNYNYHILGGNGSSVFTASGTGDGLLSHCLIGNSSNSSTAYSASVVDILDPFSTTKNKTVRTLYGNSSFTSLWLASSLWQSTSALTSLVIYPTSNTFITGSRFSIYGVKG